MFPRFVSFLRVLIPEPGLSVGSATSLKRSETERDLFLISYKSTRPFVFESAWLTSGWDGSSKENAMKLPLLEEKNAQRDGELSLG
jgi:hypothetical protein